MDDATILWIVLLGSCVALTVLVCSLPLTAVTAIVTDNLMDKYADWRSDRQGSTTNKGSS